MRFTIKNLKICLGTLCLLPFLAGGSPQFIGATFFMGKDYSSLIGKKFGRLLIKSVSHKSKGHTIMLCICDCGVLCTKSIFSLLKHEIKSCGCLRREMIIRKNTTHGLSKSKSPLYGRWHNIISRCFDENNKNYNRYGS